MTQIEHEPSSPQDPESGNAQSQAYDSSKITVLRGLEALR